MLSITLKTYLGLEGVAVRLMKTKCRLAPERARWLAQHWARPLHADDPEGEWVILGGPAHKRRSGQPYRLDEVLAAWAAIEAPELIVEASDDSLAQWFPRGEHSLAEYHRRLQAVRRCRVERLDDAGHMLHHDQPSRVAALIEAHLA